MPNAAYADEGILMTSPDGKLAYTLKTGEGGISHSLKADGSVILEEAPLGLTIDGTDVAKGVKDLTVRQTEQDKTVVFPTRGNRSEGRVSYHEYVVSSNPGSFNFRVRVYTDGVAFRYEFPMALKEKRSVRINGENTTFRFPAESIYWTQAGHYALTACEGIWTPKRIEEFPAKTDSPDTYVYTMPMTVELPSGNIALIQEAGNFGLDWGGTKLIREGGDWVTSYYYDKDGFEVDTQSGTPWKVVLVASDLNGLVQNDIIASLAPAPDKKLFPDGFATSWVKPSRLLWSWLDHHADHDQQYHYVDAASELGFEAVLVDDGWEKWNKDGEDGRALLKKLVSYAKEKNIAIWVWKRFSDINKPNDDWKDMRAFFDEMKEMGVVGMKVDFMDSNSQSVLQFYDAAVRKAAERQLMINFHGANPPEGEPNTWPNEMTREGIYAMEWGRLPAQHLTALPFTRMISGHADFTGGRFTDASKLNGTSWPFQMASVIIFTSPALHYTTKPEDWEKAFPMNSRQRDVVRSIPSTWDETIVLPGSKIGKLAGFARRKGKVWYVAMINGSNEEEYSGELSLDFLPEGAFELCILSDDPDNNASWSTRGELRDRLFKPKVTMRAGGGYVARFRPVKVVMPSK